MRNRLTIIFLIILLLSLASSVVSQDSNDSAAREVVILAFQSLANSHRYRMESSASFYFTPEDGKTYELHQEFSSRGEVDTGSNYLVRAFMNTTTFSDTTNDITPIVDLPAFEMDQLSYNEIIVVNFDSVVTDNESIFSNVELGWQSLNELKQSVNDEITQLTIDSLSAFASPQDMLIYKDVLLSIQEKEPEIIGDVTTSVFDLELDALSLMTTQSSESTSESMRMYNENIGLLDNSELSLQMTVWIGVEDGLLYKLETNEHTSFPFLTEGLPGTPYDYESMSSVVAFFWDHGTVDEIDLPEEIAALINGD